MSNYRGAASGSKWGNGKGPFNSPTKVPLKGLFDNGIWHCNCTPRMPAEHFQTKNGGKNHGRWFYTCQNTPNRCGFFLWDDDAKLREESAVLGNSRSEPQSNPQTPSSNRTIQYPITPVTGSRSTMLPSRKPGLSSRTPRQVLQAEVDDDSDEYFDFPLNSEEEALFSEAADRFSDPTTIRKPASMAPPATPTKSGRAEGNDSPGKRKRPNTPPATWPTPSSVTDEDEYEILTKPTTRTLFSPRYPKLPSPPDQRLEASDAFSPSVTPSPQRFRDATASAGGSESVVEVIDFLKDNRVEMKEETLSSLKQLLSKHAAKSQGIMKGRDAARLALKGKDVKIAELNYRVASLEAERETDRTVIRSLRRDQGV
ncbi:MAG: hypothetical protein M4579_002552 [Chaenotheca gracillima]|nr:MAG: hypothetical protein M4579_002552 [Chaenotheca gracillima]